MNDVNLTMFGTKNEILAEGTIGFTVLAPRQGFIGRQHPKTVGRFFGQTAQTRWLRQPRPAAAEATDKNIGESQ